LKFDFSINTSLYICSASFGYKYRRGINNILVLLIGGSPITMLTHLVVTLAIGAKKLSQNKTFVLDMLTIEKLAAATNLCVDKIGLLTLNRPVIDKSTIKQYSDVGPDDILHYAAIAVSHPQNQNVM
jgi:H+-transporting ATPase